MIVAFIDECLHAGHSVESICRILTSQGCQLAARTYRSWASSSQSAADRTASDAIVEDAVGDVVWTIDEHDPMPGVRRLTPKELYGRRKMTALIQRHIPHASSGSVDRAMTALGLNGIRCAKGIRTTIPAKDGTRAGDLLDRDFIAPAPNRTWAMDFTYVCTWAGFTYLSFIVEVFTQKSIAWHAPTSKDVNLVMTPLRMTTWQRQREGHPIEPGEFIDHADAASQYTSITFTEHLELEGTNPWIRTAANTLDNALMETVNRMFKTEYIRTTVFHASPYRTITDVEWATAGWVDW